MRNILIFNVSSVAVLPSEQNGVKLVGGLNLFAMTVLLLLVILQLSSS